MGERSTLSTPATFLSAMRLFVSWPFLRSFLSPPVFPTRTLTSASPHPMLIVWQCCSLPSQVPGVEISDVELRREPRPSYFVDTLEGLRPGLGAGKPVLLLGEDQLMSFPQWHRYQDILDQVELWFVPRAGRHCSDTPEVPARALFAINPFDSLSSTLIRNRLQQGLSVDGLVPASVAAYIAEHGLYRGQ